MHLFGEKILYSDLAFTEVSSWWSNWQQVIIYSGSLQSGDKQMS